MRDDNAVAFNRLHLVLQLAGAVEHAESDSNHGFAAAERALAGLIRRPGKTQPGSEVGLDGGVDVAIVRKEFAGVGIERGPASFCFPHRRVVFVTHAVVEG